MTKTAPTVHILNGLLEGGAANASKRLLAGLRAQNIDAKLYHSARVKPDSDPAIEPAKWRSSGLGGIVDQIKFRLHRESFKRKVRHRPPGSEIFTSPRGAAETIWPPHNLEIGASDIIHLHWIAKLVDYGSFFRSLPKNQPVVWTLHDMNPFTGGCHFTGGCERFISGCGDCPQLPQASPQDISYQFHQIKRDALQHVNLHVVGVSRWMRDQAMKSPIFSNARSFQHIALGLPLDKFAPIDRAAARKELGIDPDAFVFAFGAADIRNLRKGVGLLLEALEQIADLPNAVGLMFGGGELPKVQHPIPTIRPMGYIRDIQKMMAIYSASDVYVLPSIEDNLPLTCVESLASGTPVIAFDEGGVPDMVRPNTTGWLVPNGDAAALGKQIRNVALNQRAEAIRMGTLAREVALSEFTSEREATEYAELYAKLLAENAAS